MPNLNIHLLPGMIVRHPDRPDWGKGQVQSNVGGRVTVNFTETGKLVFDNARVELVPIFDSDENALRMINNTTFTSKQ